MKKVIKATNACPFCGELSTHVLGPKTEPLTSSHSKGYQVECINCGARGPCKMIDAPSAIAVWDQGDVFYKRPFIDKFR